MLHQLGLLDRLGPLGRYLLANFLDHQQALDPKYKGQNQQVQYHLDLQLVYRGKDHFLLRNFQQFEEADL
jgi:hypothetical protein